MRTDIALELKMLLDASDDPLWAPVVQRWIAAFDGWWEHDRGEARDPASAIALHALRMQWPGTDAHRTAMFLGHLPFNRWHAATLSGEKRWNPLIQSFREYVQECSPEAVITFVAPDFEDRRLRETSQWLWAMWRVQWLSRNGPDV
ncbi:hypothetical protein [Paraburkholderia tropica]|uniref:hypothetical protein n=1 Tax=Paraburkholderia tropica TaxID=92647 RepID=UPI002AB5F5D1|nr:hypothetical protein [Paraburkholderia tropica]